MTAGAAALMGAIFATTLTCCMQPASAKSLQTQWSANPGAAILEQQAEVQVDGFGSQSWGMSGSDGHGDEMVLDPSPYALHPANPSMRVRVCAVVKHSLCG